MYGSKQTSYAHFHRPFRYDVDLSGTPNQPARRSTLHPRRQATCRSHGLVQVNTPDVSGNGSGARVRDAPFDWRQRQQACRVASVDCETQSHHNHAKGTSIRGDIFIFRRARVAAGLVLVPRPGRAPRVPRHRGLSDRDPYEARAERAPAVRDIEEPSTVHRCMSSTHYNHSHSQCQTGGADALKRKNTMDNARALDEP